VWAEQHPTGGTQRGRGDRVELRQLRFFLTLAEELHFGRAAAREHIVQSALSQHIQRLEREIGVPLVERNTHHVRLTRAGDVLTTAARAILRDVERAEIATREASANTEVLRAAVGDASLDSMPQILRSVQYNHPNLVVHRMETPVVTQYRMLAEHTLDIGVGRASHAPAGIATELFRLDPLGVLTGASMKLSDGDVVPVQALSDVPVLFDEDARSPEFTEFVLDMCRAAGFTPVRFPGSVQSARAAAFLVAQQRCVALLPRSCDLLLPGVTWRPLVPTCPYPWSLLWRADDISWPVNAVRRSARALADKLGWLGAGASR
jgi:DNA-binding transcriptional LysR family regulator